MNWPDIVPLILFGALSAFLVVSRVTRGRYAAPGYLSHLCAFLFVLLVARWISLPAALWILALLSFLALREYFSLVDLRLGDRWGVLGAYLSIPFMFCLVTIDWYTFFIVSIPVYSFLVIPFLVALGDTEGKGSVLSIGAIVFGLFFFVYCTGHFAYLAVYSNWTALLLVLSVAACYGVATATRGLGRTVGFLLGSAATLALAMALGPWAEIPRYHAAGLAVLIAVCVHVGDFTVGVLEHDLGVRDDDLVPGRGRLLDSLKAYLFTAPIAFHFLHWQLGFGD